MTGDGNGDGGRWADGAAVEAGSSVGAGGVEIPAASAGMTVEGGAGVTREGGAGVTGEGAAR